MRQRIVDFGVTVVVMPDLPLYSLAPGGQLLRLVGIDGDLPAYDACLDPGRDSKPHPTSRAANE
jgi:hypothetical protein